VSGSRSAQIPEKRLRQLLAAVNRIARDGDDWHVDGDWPGLQIVLPKRRSARIVFVTKLSGLLGFDFDVFTSNQTVVRGYGVLSRAYVGALARVCPRGVIHFVGDLDPLDLTAYLSLASRLHTLGRMIRYLGVDGAWVQRCRRALKRDKLPTIPMSDFEKAHFELLKGVGIPWERIIGRQALDVLDSGFKLELEGATNPAFYAEGFSKRLAKDVLQVRERA
jgi:hypothetical protein